MTNNEMIVKTNTYLSLILALLFSGLLKGQNNTTHNSNFLLQLNKTDSNILHFVEDSIISFSKLSDYSVMFFYEGNNYNVGFDIPLTKAEVSNRFYKYKPIPANTYYTDINWLDNYRSFSVTGFSKMYEHKRKANRYNNDSIKYNSPILKSLLSDYNKIFTKKETQLIHDVIKENIVKKIDSTFLNNNNNSFTTQRMIDFETYDIFPHSTFNSLIHILRISIEEGEIRGYRSDSLIHKLSNTDRHREYYNRPEAQKIFNEFGKDTGFSDTVYVVEDCNSISLSENIQFNDITDSLNLINYLSPWMIKYHKPLSLLTVDFNYKAIGLDYYHYIDDVKYDIKTIWLDYNKVKELLIKRKVNFDVYESIFTKNLFDIFEIEHEYWEKENYKK